MTCQRPPAGWYCTRPEGHEGPCAAHPVTHPPDPVSLTLTVAEIMDLAQTAGLEIDGDRSVSGDDLDAEYTVIPCPKSGLDDDGTTHHYRYVVYDEEYPEEGSTGLGPELKTP